MKKTFKFILLLILIPCLVNAKDFSDAKNAANDYMKERFESNYSRYIINDTYLYGLDSSYKIFDSSSDGFKTGGLLNSVEFLMSKKNSSNESSWLHDLNGYWTMTKDGEKRNIINANGIDSLNETNMSYTRPTEYIKNGTRVTGKGTYKNPWVFTEKATVEIFSSKHKDYDDAHNEIEIEPITTSSPNPQIIEYSKNASFNLKVKSGYVLNEKGTIDSCGGKIVNNILTFENVMDNITCRVLYDLKNVKLTFDSNGGESINEEYTINYLGTYPKLPTPTRAGYEFLGWYTGKTGGIKVESNDEVLATADIVLYARWDSNFISCYDVFNSYKCANVSEGNGEYNLNYTGNCRFIDDGYGNCRVKFLSSGTLTLAQSMSVDMFLVGSGSSGGEGYKHQQNQPGTGGETILKTDYMLEKNTAHTITIGTSNNNTTFNNLVAHSGKNNDKTGQCEFLESVNNSCVYKDNGYEGHYGASGHQTKFGGGEPSKGGNCYSVNACSSHATTGAANTGGGGGSGNMDRGSCINTIDTIWGVVNQPYDYGCGGAGGGTGVVIIRSKSLTKKTTEIKIDGESIGNYSGNFKIEGNKDNWKIKFISSGELELYDSIDTDIFVVGGGAGNAGAGGYASTYLRQNLSKNNTYTIKVGSGGFVNFKGEQSYIKVNDEISYYADGGTSASDGGNKAKESYGKNQYNQNDKPWSNQTTCEFDEGTISTGCYDGDGYAYSGGGSSNDTAYAGGGGTKGKDGRANTGGGGGSNAAGGSGVVIIRKMKANEIKIGNTSIGNYSGNFKIEGDENNWKIKFTSSGQLELYDNINTDIFVVGGGGGNAGAGGYASTYLRQNLSKNNIYTIKVGYGGFTNSAGEKSYINVNDELSYYADGGAASNGNGGNKTKESYGKNQYNQKDKPWSNQTTCEFDEGTISTGCFDGDGYAYSGGGSSNDTAYAGGGGTKGKAGTPNTGGGGGKDAIGGSGIVIIRKMKANEIKIGNTSIGNYSGNFKIEGNENNWKIKFTSSGQLMLYDNIDTDIFVVGGGGGNAGAGGYASTYLRQNLSKKNTYTIKVGYGGFTNSAGEKSYINVNDELSYYADGGAASNGNGGNKAKEFYGKNQYNQKDKPWSNQTTCEFDEGTISTGCFDGDGYAYSGGGSTDKNAYVGGGGAKGKAGTPNTGGGGGKDAIGGSGVVIIRKMKANEIKIGNTAIGNYSGNFKIEGNENNWKIKFTSSGELKLYDNVDTDVFVVGGGGGGARAGGYATTYLRQNLSKNNTYTIKVGYGGFKDTGGEKSYIKVNDTISYYADGGTSTTNGGNEIKESYGRNQYNQKNKPWSNQTTCEFNEGTISAGCFDGDGYAYSGGGSTDKNAYAGGGGASGKAGTPNTGGGGGKDANGGSGIVIIRKMKANEIKIGNTAIGNYSGNFKIEGNKDNWKIEFTSSGELKLYDNVDTDIFVVGGGGGNVGAGGYASTYLRQNLSKKNTYSIKVGAGGLYTKSNTSGEQSYIKVNDTVSYYADGGAASNGNGGNKANESYGRNQYYSTNKPWSNQTTCEFDEGTPLGCFDGDAYAYSGGGSSNDTTYAGGGGAKGKAGTSNTGGGGGTNANGGSGVVIIRKMKKGSEIKIDGKSIGNYSGNFKIEGDENNWKIKFTSSGELKLYDNVDTDVFVVGGGGGNARAGGYATTYFRQNLSKKNTYTIKIGAGGFAKSNTSGEQSYIKVNDTISYYADGGTSTTNGGNEIKESYGRNQYNQKNKPWSNQTTCEFNEGTISAGCFDGDGYAYSGGGSTDKNAYAGGGGASGKAGTPNTGGGGGTNANGGSGIVIIRKTKSNEIKIGNTAIGNYSGNFKIEGNKDNWKIEFTSSGELKLYDNVDTDVFVVGGGGGNAGAGGYASTYLRQNLSKTNTYSIKVGAGGLYTKSNTSGEQSYIKVNDTVSYYADGGAASTGNGGNKAKESYGKGQYYTTNKPWSNQTTCEFDEGTPLGCFDGDAYAYSGGGSSNDTTYAGGGGAKGKVGTPNTGGGGGTNANGGSGVVIIRKMKKASEIKIDGKSIGNYSGNFKIEKDKDDWKIKFTSNGELKLYDNIDVDIFVVGGGGANYGAGGFALTYLRQNLSKNNTYTIKVGAGGFANAGGELSYLKVNSDLSYLAYGGKQQGGDGGNGKAESYGKKQYTSKNKSWSNQTTCEFNEGNITTGCYDGDAYAYSGGGSTDNNTSPGGGGAKDKAGTPNTGGGGGTNANGGSGIVIIRKMKANEIKVAGKTIGNYSGNYKIEENKNSWKIKFTSSGILKLYDNIDADIFVVGGGGYGAGAGGYASTYLRQNLSKNNTYTINVGYGGYKNAAGEKSSIKVNDTISYYADGGAVSTGNGGNKANESYGKNQYNQKNKPWFNQTTCEFNEGTISAGCFDGDSYAYSGGGSSNETKYAGGGGAKGKAGTPNTGGGGGKDAIGGSGVVIIRKMKVNEIKIDGKSIGNYTGNYKIEGNKNNWKIKFTSSGELKLYDNIDADIFVVGGGGGGAGAGGYASTYLRQSLSKNNTYSIKIGAGGLKDTAGEKSYINVNDKMTYYADGGAASNGNGGNKAKQVYGKNQYSQKNKPWSGQSTCEFNEGTIDGCNGGDKFAYSGGGSNDSTAYAGGGGAKEKAGTPNTGGAGGTKANGGSGIIIIRNQR